MADPEQTEDLAQLLARLKDEYNVNESEIARRIGVAPATVNSWTRRTRGGKRGVRPETLRALAAAFPKFSEDQISAPPAASPLAPSALKRKAASLSCTAASPKSNNAW